MRAAGVRRNFGLMREASCEAPSVSEAGWGERAVPRGAEPPPSAARSSLIHRTRAPGPTGLAPPRSGVISLRLAVRMHSQARLRETPFALRGEVSWDDYGSCGVGGVRRWRSSTSTNKVNSAAVKIHIQSGISLDELAAA